MSDAKPTVMSGDRRCPSCGAPLPADAPMGLCVQCLLGIGLPSRAPAAAFGVPPSGGAADEPAKAGTPSETAPLAAQESRAAFEQPGDPIGRYKLLQKIGEGGCG